MALSRLWWAAPAAGLFACGQPGGRSGEAVNVRVQLDRSGPEFGTVRIEGLEPRALRAAARGQSDRVAVYATAGSIDPSTPPLAGAWRRTGRALEFVPRFPPSAGLVLSVRLDTAALGGRDPGEPLVRRFDLLADQRDAGAPELLAIHPRADSLPENLLRWYLEFSTPMRPGQALAHARLLDDRGNEVAGAFLDLGEELWDPAGKRLTLLFDPGRVKRGIRTNLESGRPLVAGRWYTLRIDPGWRDARGWPLDRPVSKRFVATPADHRGPDPATWRLVVPDVGSASALEVDFGEPLDHALAARLIAVLDETGAPVLGAASLEDTDQRWRFQPSARWTAGRYRIDVSPELEDVAGNRPTRAFDAEVGSSAKTPGRAAPPTARWFRPTPVD